MRILIVENEPRDVREYQRVLGVHYSLQIESSLAGLARVSGETSNRVDLVISEMEFPDGDLRNHLASNQVTVPLIVVSKVSDLSCMQGAVRLGAAHYLVKPYHENALILAVERCLSVEKSAPVGVTIDTFEVVSEDNVRSAQLTAKEMQIFSALRENWEMPVQRERLVKQIWGRVRVCGKSLDVHVFHLRRKIAPLGLKIEYVADRGFRLFNARQRGPTPSAGAPNDSCETR
ncbi:MAG: winged helix-turn-helix domain-containing protein [Bdellovibrionota bacterium]